jgi:sporulation protein YlmC with PRC-barrel domain
MRKLGISVAVLALLLTTCFDFSEARDKSTVLKASSLIGKKVQDTEGKKLGDIKDLVIDPADGDIQYAVLDFGGFLGLGDKYFAVPWDALQLTDDQKAVVLDVRKKDLKQAPGFDKNNWPDLGSRETSIVIYEFYGVPLPEETPPMTKPRGE